MNETRRTAHRLSPRHYVAIALTAASVLLFEIAITRVLSVVLWYHFAFLSISLAMLGLGAPGVWFAVRRPGPRVLPVSLLLAGAALPASVIAIFKLGRPLHEVGRLYPGVARLLDPGLLLVIAAVLAPMLCLGAAACLLILEASDREVAGLYGADLLGATAGAVGVIPLLVVAPTPFVIAGTGLLPLGAAWLLAPRLRAVALSLAAVLVALVFWGEPFRLRFAKEYEERADVVYERWSPTARITVFPSPFFHPRPDLAFGWGFGSRYVPRPAEQLWIEQDGSAGTPITRLAEPARLARRGGDLSPELAHLFFDVTSVGYQVAPPTRACVIGAGGGRDVLTALLAGAQSVDAVELNPVIVHVVSEVFGDFSGDVYHLPGVHAVIGEGRSFLTRTRTAGSYDALQISLIDSWAATAAGAFALSENYLYTVEALRLYWNRLSPDGVLSISRWSRTDRAQEIVRLAVLTRRALEEEGIERPGDHVAIASAGALSTLLVRRSPIDREFFTRLDTVCRERGFLREWPLAAGEPLPSPAARILAAGATRTDSPGVDARPSTDDRPFFFQTVPMFGEIDRETLARMSPNESSVLLLRSLLLWISGLALALFLAPLVFLRGRATGAGLLQGGAYFLLIGFAFMFVEMPWIQRFILYLGHPSYAASLVLSTLLLAAGGGSIAASRLGPASSGRLLLVLPPLVSLLNWLMTGIFEHSVGAHAALRVAAGIALVAPAGVLMGLALPAGMIRFGEVNRAWFWAVNGIASVVASVLALALSMSLGLRAVVYLGAALYLVAVAVLLHPRNGRERPEKARFVAGERGLDG